MRAKGPLTVQDIARVALAGLTMLGAALLSIGAAAQPHVYRWVDPQGVVHYGQSLDGMPAEAQHQVVGSLTSEQRAAAGAALRGFATIRSLSLVSIDGEPGGRLVLIRDAVEQAQAVLPPGPLRSALGTAMRYNDQLADFYPAVKRRGSVRQALAAVTPSCPFTARVLAGAPAARLAAHPRIPVSDNPVHATRALKDCALAAVAESQRLLDLSASVDPAAPAAAHRAPNPSRESR